MLILIVVKIRNPLKLLTGMQIQLAQKEAHIAELEATSSGETIRLTASLEAARGELVRIEQEHV